MDEGKIYAWAAVVVIVGIGLAAWICIAVDRYGCEQQWAGSGMRSRYSAFGGCVVESKDGRWVPSKAYREVAP